MISHKKLLPLVETGKDYPEEYNIKIYDIWEFERSQAFEIIEYDWDFADQLLNKIEKVIFENDNPGFEIAPLSISHINKLQRYSASLNDIKERFALDFFFALERYYPFNKDITIYRKHPEYLFWLSLKLRQYDLALINTSNFLDFQLRKNYKNDSEKFIEHIDICIKQYPYLFSDRLIERINKWIEQHSQKISKSDSVAQIDYEMKGFENPDLVLVAQTDNGIKDTQSKKNQPHPKFTWNETTESEKQLNYLYISLVDKKYIDKIKLDDFLSHFKGIHENIKPINWLSEQYGLIYLIDKLKPNLNNHLFTGKNDTIAIAYFAKHFHHKGKPINVATWRKVKTENKDVHNELTNSIDIIISHL